MNSIQNTEHFFDFSNGGGADNIYIQMSGSAPSLQPYVFVGGTGYNFIATNSSYFALGAFSHICFTVNSTGYGSVCVERGIENRSHLR